MDNESNPWKDAGCFCSAHQDCRSGALSGCGPCAKAHIEALDKIALVVTKFAAESGSRRPEPPRREAEQFMSAILSTRAHYEAALASAKKLRDKRIYELTEIAYLASLREDMKALDALTPAKGKEKKP